MNGWARLAAAAVTLLGAAAFAAPPNPAPAPNYFHSELPAAEARQLLDQFQHTGPTGPCYLEFELTHLPRRGPATVSRGRLWSSRNAQGTLIRIELDGGSHLLLQNGPGAQAWRWSLGNTAMIPATAPIQPGLELTAFDLQMPFVYWAQTTPVTLTRISGRPAYAFLFTAPPGYGAIFGVRAYLDSEYRAPVQIDTLGGPEQTLKTLSLLGVKEVAGQWIVKSLEVRDELSRSKTRLTVTGAALRLDLSSSLFEPANLGESVAAPGGVQRW
jgi:hypothetical protein